MRDFLGGKAVHATRVLLSVLLLAFVPGAASAVAVGDVTELSGPGAFTGATTVIDFDGAADGSAANTLYSGSGVAFSNCDPLPCSSAPIPIENWTDPPLSRVTTSPANVIATTLDYQDSGSEFSDFLDLFFTSGTLEVGAWFGNDQGIQPTMQMQLSVYDVSDALIGLVLVDVNANTSVDQFAGLRSNSTPFYRARFEHVLAQGDLSVVLDDVRFSTPVPEPGSAALLGLGLGLLTLRRRRRA
jgi:hypothetical protein